MGCPAAARSVPSRLRHPRSDLRPRRYLQRPGPHNGECARPAPSEDDFQKPLAERHRRALGRKRASRIARSRRRLQRASPSPTAERGTLPTTTRTARTTRLKRRLPAVVFPLLRREPALLSWLAGGWAVCITGTTGLCKKWAGWFGELHCLPWRVGPIRAIPPTRRFLPELQSA